MNGISKTNLADIHAQSLDNSTKIALVQQSLVSLQNEVTNLATTVSQYIQNDQLSKRPNWALWIAFASLVVLMCSGGWMVLTLKINAEIHPMAERMATMETSQDVLSKEAILARDRLTTILSQNQSSIDDRVNLNKNLDSLKDRIASLAASQAADHAERTTHEIEIETQFDADSQLRNLQFAEQQRVNKTIWEQNKHLGAYANGPFFFPNISSRDGKQAR